MSDITIVTAFFDLGRKNWPGFLQRTTDTYFQSFERLSHLKNDMVIYTSNDFVDNVKSIRKKSSPQSKTTVVSIDLDTNFSLPLSVVHHLQKQPEYVKFVDNPGLPEYWNPYYVIVNFCKSSFVVDAIENRNVTTDLVAWIDFGYARTDDTIPKSSEWGYDFDPSKMHYFNLKPIDLNRPIFDIVRTNDVTIMGCHIVGGKEAWSIHKEECNKSMDALIQCGLIDDDQTILLMNYRRKHTENFYELHTIDASKEGWFVIFKNFNMKG